MPEGPAILSPRSRLRRTIWLIESLATFGMPGMSPPCSLTAFTRSVLNRPNSPKM